MQQKNHQRVTFNQTVTAMRREKQSQTVKTSQTTGVKNSNGQTNTGTSPRKS